MNALEIIESLKNGNKRFVNDNKSEKTNSHDQRLKLVNGQSPYAVILSCSDSRLPPELIFDTGLGELFVIRVAGNIANTDSIASIEYAVANLNSKLIVVLGHQSCGAVTAALQTVDLGYNLNHLLAQIKPATLKTKSDDIEENVKSNCSHSSSQLLKRSEIVSEAVKNDGVKIVQAYYNLDSGLVDFFD